MSEFSDRPLVADSITGVRSFNVDRLGRLTGVTHEMVWRPGVNEAECRREVADVMTANIRRAIGGYVSLSADPVAPKKQHEVAALGCACGFYAYTDRSSNDYGHAGRVTGIIRGTGLVTVGDRGFRASTGEILALVEPQMAKAKKEPKAGAWERLSLWAGDDSRFLAVGAVGIPVGIASLVLTLAAVFGVSLWFLPMLAVPAAVVTLMSAAVHGGDLRVARAHAPLNYHSLSFDFYTDPPVSAERFALVRRNYPDVPVFKTLDAALAAFPLSEPPTPTPDDDDFWTREA